MVMPARIYDGAAKVAENAENQPTACVLCSHNCGLRVDVKDNTIVAVRGDESHPSSRGYTCNKGYAISSYVKHRLRVEHPLKRRPDGSFERIGWDQAIQEIAAKLNHIRREHSPRAIGVVGAGGQGNHSSALGIIPFLYGIGSPMIFNALGQEKIQHGLVDRRLFRATHDLYLYGDEHRTDYLIIIGSNTLISNRGVNATETLKELVRDERRRLVVVDPRVSDTARRADRHLRVIPGQDVHLLLALAGVIVQEGLVDEAFIRTRTRGARKVMAQMRRVDVAEMARRCGIPVADIEATAREFAAADSASINWDLGLEQSLHSTLTSYLIRVILLLTGNLGRQGGNLFLQQFGPRAPFMPFMARSGASGIAAVPMFMPMGQFSPILIPEEIERNHPERLRALIVDGANPLVSYADSKRFRSAFEKLDLLVVVEPAMTETARVADYVLPTPTGYEKWEMSFFPKDKIVPQLRPPLLRGPEEALPEVEIYYRLARAMGVVPEAPRVLHWLARRARSPLGAATYVATLFTLAGARLERPQTSAARVAFWLYETLGPTLGNPLQSLIWLVSLGYAMTRRDHIERALPEARHIRNPFALGEFIFQKLLDHPEGVLVGEQDADKNFEEFCRYRDGRARIYQADFANDIERLLQTDPQVKDTEFPFILNGGLRTGWSANTIIRDPAWRKGKGPHSALHMSVEDAAAMGLDSGARVRLVTRRGEVVVPVKVEANTRPGHVHLPNIFDLKYPDPVTGELVSTGVSINDLSDADDRDPYTGIPRLKYIRCRIEATAPVSAAVAQGA